MKDAYYFSHDSNAKDDPKCVMLIETLQLEGYGIFWMLVETLRDQPDYKYPIILIPALARRYNTTQEKIKAVVMNYGLFEIEKEEFFYSESLIRRMELKDKIIKKRIKAGKASGKKRKQLALEHKLNTCSTHAEQLKEKKGKESKVNKVNKVKEPQKHKHGEFKHVLLTDKEYETLPDKVFDRDVMIKRLDEYIETTGKTYKNHSLVLQNWAKKDTEKQPKKIPKYVAEQINLTESDIKANAEFLANGGVSGIFKRGANAE